MKEALVCLLVLSLGTFAVLALSPPQVEVVETQTVTVERGDTLWTYLSRIDGREKYDGHQIINLIQNMNGLESLTLTPGQTITIPREVK